MVTKAIILAVVDEADELAITQRLLHNRYGRDYEVLCDDAPAQALDRLQALAAAGRQVAVLLADQWMPEMNGTTFLSNAKQWFPYARTVLLFARHDPAAAVQRFQAAALGQIDCFVVKPLGEPDEAFHQLITELLVEWTHTHQATYTMVQLVDEAWNPRSHEFRNLLERYGIPYHFYAADSAEGKALLQQSEYSSGPFPVLRLANGTVLANPSLTAVAAALGAPTRKPRGVYDVTVVGGGPAGLSAAVYGASEGLRTLVIEREAIGGQAGTSSRIRNYLGFPRGITGGALARGAWEQAALFGTEYALLQAAEGLRVEGKHRIVTLSDGTEVVSRAVVLALGVRYRRLGIPALEALVGAGVFYGAALSEATAMQGQPVVVVGGGNSAGQAAVHLAKFAASVTLVVRGVSLAASMSDYLVKEIEHNEKIQVMTETQVADGGGQHQLAWLVLQHGQAGVKITVDAAGLFVLIGGYPHTDWLAGSLQRDEQGYLLTDQALVQCYSSFASLG